MCQLAFLVIPASRIVCFTVRCIRDSSKSLRPIGGAQVAAGNGVGRAPRNPGKPLAKEAAARKKEKKASIV